MRQVFAALLVAAAVLLAPAQPASASCAQRTLGDQVASAEVVAVGTVTSTRMTFAPAGPVITFQPERVLKGTLTTSVQVYLGPTHGGAVTSVDYRAASPQVHTLYLRDARDGSFETDGCSGSHAGRPTADEEKLLGAGTRVDAAADTGIPGPLVAVLAVAVLAVALVVVLGARPSRT